MSAFRLQTFAPDRRPGPRSRSTSAGPRRCARRPSSGFLAGQSAAAEAFLEDQARLTSDLIEAIADARLTNEAARRHVAATLAPLVEMLCRTIAPALAEAGFADEIGRLVARALQAAPGARPRLRCAPERVERLTGCWRARASTRSSRRRRSSCRARRRSSGTRATTTSTSTPASPRSRLAWRRISIRTRNDAHDTASMDDPNAAEARSAAPAPSPRAGPIAPSRWRGRCAPAPFSGCRSR